MKVEDDDAFMLLRIEGISSESDEVGIQSCGSSSQLIFC